jgi:hypothetical protein
MSKTRTIIRYCLVVLLLCCAGLTVYLWPYRPVLLVKRDFQKLEMEAILRLDDSKQQLVTSHMELVPSHIKGWQVQQDSILHYDSRTGECTARSAKPLTSTPFGPLCYSSNGLWLTYFNHSDNTLGIYHPEKHQLIKNLPAAGISIEPHHTAVGFSKNAKYLWSRIGHSLFLYETDTFSLLHEIQIEPQFVSLKPRIVHLRDGVVIDISDDGKQLTIADKNLDVVGLIDLTTKQQHTIPNANMANILTDQRTVLAFKMDEHGVIAKQPVLYRVGRTDQLVTVSNPLSNSCTGHFLCMNDRFLVTFQQPASVTEEPFFWKWIPQGYHAKLKELMGLFQFKVPFTVWSAESGDVLHRFTLSLPGTMNMNGSHSFNRVNSHADVISSDGTLLGLSDTASLSLWNIPPRRHWSCWVVAGGFVLLAMWCGWPRRGTVLAAKPVH